jgi:hypothetical protein
MNADNAIAWKARLLISDTWREATPEEIAKATQVSLNCRYSVPHGWECFINPGRSLTVVACHTR